MNTIHGGDIWGAARRLGISPSEIMDFSASICPIGPSPLAISAIKEGMATVCAYPDREAFALRQALADYHGLSISNILPANGSTELIYLIPQVLKPEKALIAEPAFSEYRCSLELSGVNVEDFSALEKDLFAIDVKGLINRLRQGFDVFYIANPANPTGAFMCKDALFEIAQACAEHSAYLVVDEAFVDFVEHGSVKVFVKGFKNLIVLRSMTKFFSIPGLRLGYLVAHESLIERFSARMPPWSVNSLALLAGEKTIGDKAHMQRVREWFGEESGFLYEGLKNTGRLKPYPSSANFFMLKVMAEGVDMAHLKTALLREKILIRGLSDFKGLEGFIRVSLRTRDENMLLINTLSAMGLT